MKDFSADLMDINQTSMNESLPCTLGDISPITFHASLVQKQLFPRQKLEWKNHIFYCPKTNSRLMMGQPQSFGVNHLFYYCDLTHGTSEPHGHVESQRVNKC